eukprot:TRINITY_DN1356_c0_g1_i1.p2 TRINITY_DN1356_c0_g1~~TRINITY_DN1356_c0_g1_i1.p2  ORF type:complete len:100 (-),score=10.49 TRINITY_DN1356_c0_g1_i1:152-451(-)
MDNGMCVWTDWCVVMPSLGSQGISALASLANMVNESEADVEAEASTGSSRAVYFGAPLADALKNTTELNPYATVPLPMEDCIMYLEAFGMLLRDELCVR